VILGLKFPMCESDFLSEQAQKEAAFGITDKKCVCNGLQQVLRMAEFYRDYAIDVKRIPSTPETKEGALKIVKEFLQKITADDACSWRGRDWVNRARSEAVACEREKDGCLMALEWVRAAVHEDFCIDSKLTCQKWQPGLGVDFVEAQPYNDIRWAMYGLAGFGRLTEEDAVKTLKESLKRHSCE